MASTELYSGLTLADILNHIFFEVAQTAGTTITYDRFPRWYVVQKINDRLNKFVLHSQCNKRTALLVMKEGYRNYKLPKDCMEDGIISYPKFFLSSNTYQNLEIKDVKYLDEHFEGWKTAPEDDVPLYVYRGQKYGNIQTLGVYPPPTTDGVSYAASPDSGIGIGTVKPSSTEMVSGTMTNAINHSTHPSLPTAIYDTTVDFTALDIVAGMPCIDVTDGSYGIIDTIGANALSFGMVNFTGGTTNLAQISDTYLIPTGDFGVITSWDTDEQYVYAQNIGGMENITVPANNILIEYLPYPLQFPATAGDDQYPEIPPLYHMDFAMGTVADLLRTFGEGTKEFQRAAYYDQLFNAAVMTARGKKDSRPFGDKPVGIRPAPKGQSRRGG